MTTVYDATPVVWADIPGEWTNQISRNGEPLSWNMLREGRGMLPVLNPITAAEVREWTGQRLDAANDSKVLHTVIAAVVEMVESWKSTHPDYWPVRWRTATVMLIARYVRRRNSPSGVETVGDMGVAYVSRKDPDIAQMLEISTYTRPVVM